MEKVMQSVLDRVTRKPAETDVDQALKLLIERADQLEAAIFRLQVRALRLAYVNR